MPNETASLRQFFSRREMIAHYQVNKELNIGLFNKQTNIIYMFCKILENKRLRQMVDALGD